MIYRLRPLAITSVLAIGIVASGCKILLPAHPNSNARDGEEVRLTFLTRTNIEPEELRASDGNPGQPTAIESARIAAQKKQIEEIAKSSASEKELQAERLKLAQIETEVTNAITVRVAYRKAFPEMFPKDPNKAALAFAPLAAAAASAAVGYAFDYVSQQLKEEAELYEQQYNVARWNSAFWSLTNNSNGIVSKEVRSSLSTNRTTTIEGDPPQTTKVVKVIEEKSSSEVVTKSTWTSFYAQDIYGFVVERMVKGKPAATMAFGFAPVEGQNMFFVKPLFYEVKMAKAKVLSNRFPISYLAVAPWILKYPGTKLKTSVDVSIDAKWSEGQMLKERLIGSFTFKFPDYDISKDTRWVVGQSKLRNAEIGVFGGVPVSVGSDGMPLTEKDNKNWLKSLGVFQLRVLVTEKDTSNAKNRIEELRKAVDEQKGPTQEKAKKLFSE